ncbi:DivIVA domain-containing protein [Nakamurella leprariae]|uniref:Cell wall synthesis protein Wag31 n=1 Tax=Nakamurella leprariae TaxID=2803911 RepID=A0A938YEJ3_9ACTN|nr:DivIVA domain-containing protein [Nakamurella leprariae]MBM9469262.1 DivIVA domain-containing protein [Nakamurella leprariae]
MPLTPADVHNVQFKKPSIGKRGYDEDEVDAFLDKVEAELTRLIELHNDAGGTAGPGIAAAPAQPSAVDAADAPTHAARLLTIAQETADKLTTEAQDRSEQLLAEAQAKADTLVTEAQAKADTTDAETQAKVQATLGDLDQQRAKLERTIAELREYEKEYRTRLKAWIHEQLGELDAVGTREQASNGEDADEAGALADADVSAANGGVTAR